MKNRKIFIIILLAFTLVFPMTSCYVDLSEASDFYIKEVQYLSLSVGDNIKFDDELYSSDDEVFIIDYLYGTALKEGYVTIRRIKDNVITHYISIDNKARNISVNYNSIMLVGESSLLEVVVSPINSSQEVIFKDYDEEVIEINGNEVRALKEGFTSITVISKENTEIYTKISLIVQNEEEIIYDPMLNIDITNKGDIDIDATLYKSLFDILVNKASNSIIGLERYDLVSNALKMTEFGSGVIYRRDAILKDGSIIENFNISDSTANIRTFRYYVISTRNLTKDASSLKIYLGEEYNTCNAKLVQYDDKIDLAVLTFESTGYFNTAVIGDSSEIKHGEFIISIGNAYGKEYFRSSSFGVVSHTNRYISTDTDGDNVSDWDSNYIQHDATINTSDNGGAIINLKGEVVGINSTKIVSLNNTVNCMSLSIPSNLTMEIVNMLEQGIRPSRAVLGVTIVDVRAFYQNKEAYLMQYPQMASIPDGLEGGFYVDEVISGGVAEAAKVKKGDIIVEFNGVPIKFSYQMRAELGKFIIGSGQVATIKVYRNGEIVSLEVVF